MYVCTYVLNFSEILLFCQHGDVLPLKIVTYATVSASLLALLLTFILLAILHKLRPNLHRIHKNLVAALFFSELVFLIGINQTDNPVRGSYNCATSMGLKVEIAK